MRWALAILLVLSVSGGAETLEEIEIRKRGLLPNTESLKAYLRSLCPTEGAEERINAYVQDLLSSDPARRDYGTRMLSREGAAAASALQAHMESARPEVRRRLRALILHAEQALRSDPIAEVYAVIVQRGVPGLASEVLKTLPLVQESARATGRNALMATSMRADEQLLLKAMSAGDPELRAAAIQAYGRVMESDSVDQLLAFAKEPTPNIQFAVAITLARQKHPDSLVLLVGLLECPNAAARFRSARLLRSLAGSRLGFAAYAAEKDRKAGVEAWRQWLASADRKVQWDAEGLAWVGMRQRILVSSGATPQSTITEIDLRGRVHRQHTVNGFVQGISGLSNGNALVSLSNGRRVEEYNAKGQRVWTSNRIIDRPTSVQRLSNGNTLFACPARGYVQEITKDSAVVWTTRLAGGTHFALRLPTGITRVSHYGQRKILDLDRKGKTVREIALDAAPFMVRTLDAGGFLVCFPQENRVSLVDEKGKTGQSWAGFLRPTSAFLLPDGDVLVGDQRGVHRVLRAGGMKTLFRAQGIVWISYY